MQTKLFICNFKSEWLI